MRLEFIPMRNVVQQGGLQLYQDLRDHKEGDGRHIIYGLVNVFLLSIIHMFAVPRQQSHYTSTKIVFGHGVLPTSPRNSLSSSWTLGWSQTVISSMRSRKSRL